MENYIYCSVCEKQKPQNHFYNFQISIDNKTLVNHTIKQACKDCLGIDSIIWKPSRSFLSQDYNLFIDRYLLEQKHIENKRKQILEKLNLQNEELVTRKQACAILRVPSASPKQHKAFLSLYVSMGLINEIRVDSPYYEKNYQIFIKKSEIDQLKTKLENGKFVQRFATTKNKFPINQYPNKNFFICPNGKQYIYIQKDSAEKLCIKCLQQKPLNAFTLQNTQQLAFDRCLYCKTCVSQDTKKRYENLPPEQKAIISKKITEKLKRREQNKAEGVDKVIKAVQNRIRKELRKTIASVQNYQIFYPQNKVYFDKPLKSIGCSRQELKEHLEKQFKEGMNWDNYGPGYEIDPHTHLPIKIDGKIVRKKQWQIDHIRPVSSFNLTNPEDVSKINHYSNLRPLWAEENASKSWVYESEETEILRGGIENS